MDFPKERTIAHGIQRKGNNILMRRLFFFRELEGQNLRRCTTEWKVNIREARRYRRLDLCILNSGAT